MSAIAFLGFDIRLNLSGNQEALIVLEAPAIILAKSDEKLPQELRAPFRNFDRALEAGNNQAQFLLETR